MATWIEHTRKGGTKNPVQLVGRVDAHGRIELKQMVQSTGVVTMPMRDGDEIELA